MFCVKQTGRMETKRPLKCGGRDHRETDRHGQRGSFLVRFDEGAYGVRLRPAHWGITALIVTRRPFRFFARHPLMVPQWRSNDQCRESEYGPKLFDAYQDRQLASSHAASIR